MPFVSSTHERGRATYLWLNEGMKVAIRERGLLDDLATVSVFELSRHEGLIRIVGAADPP